MNSLKIKPALKDHARQIAEIHRSEINNGFLSTLHIMVLTQLYKHLATHGIIFVIENDNKVTGFISGVISLKKFYISFLLHKGLFVSPYLIKEIIKPEKLKKILNVIILPFKKHGKTNSTSTVKNQNESKPSTEMPELVSIAVSRNAQQHGSGGILLNALESKLIENNITEYRVVAGSSLIGANKFYKKNGFILKNTITVHGEETSNVYHKILK